MKIITKKQEEKEEVERKELMVRKLKFMGRICAERVAQTGTVDYEMIEKDAVAISIVDDVIVGF
jgi:hypothetical protein